jgi:hypothetical protein
MDLEQMEAIIDGLNEADFAGEQMEGAYAAGSEAMYAIGDVVMDIGSGEHRFGAIAEFGFIEPPINLPLAVRQLLTYGSIHSKSLFVMV